MKFLLISIFPIFIFNNIINAQGYICAIGGGSENYSDWSDGPYSWIVEKSGFGKIIIISDADATSWLPNYFMSFGADTAYNKTISTTAIANLQSTYDELISADAIFIRGGDQWDYIRLWKGTKTDTAIQYVFNNGGVIAGTSAGAAVLGDVDFSARFGSAYPEESLRNPFYNRIQLENNFLNFVPNVLFDTHFIERGRHGRLIAMLYNYHFTESIDLIGAGIDDRTAVCITPEGIGEVMGSGAVSIFYKDDITYYSNYETNKYTIENLHADFLTKGWKYDFINKEIIYIPPSAKDVDPARVWLHPQTNFYLTGSNNIDLQITSNLYDFLSEVNSSEVVIISHPGFSTLSLITDYLSTNNYNFSVVNLTSSNLDDPIETNKINNATCFIFAGDSLNVLSYLNQPGGLVNTEFYNSMASNIPVFFFGNSGKVAGHKFVWNTDSDLYASYRGKMTLNGGLFIAPELIFQPNIFLESDFYENRMSAVLWGMMRNRNRIGLYLNGNDLVKIKSFENSISGNVRTPYIILDARATTKVDSSIYRASSSIGARQVVAMNNLRVSLTNYSQINYLMEQGKFDYLTGVEEEFSISQPEDFVLFQNYPNPFNPVTNIKFSIPYAGAEHALSVLKVYDILGREVSTLINENKSTGTFEIKFNASHLPSGVYFYRLTVGNYSQTKSMVLMK